MLQGLGIKIGQETEWVRTTNQLIPSLKHWSRNKRNYFVDDISKVLTATKKKLSETLLLLLAASLFSLCIRQLRATLDEHYIIKFAGFLLVFEDHSLSYYFLQLQSTFGFTTWLQFKLERFCRMTKQANTKLSFKTITEICSNPVKALPTKPNKAMVMEKLR